MSSILITLPLILPIVVNLDMTRFGGSDLSDPGRNGPDPSADGDHRVLLHAIAPKISMGTIYRGRGSVSARGLCSADHSDSYCPESFCGLRMCWCIERLGAGK